MGNGITHEQWINTALQTYEVRLLRYAHRIIGDQARAEDVVQETFLKLCKQDSAELNGRLAQWLFTVCRNRALDVKRKESRMSVSSAIIETQGSSSSVAQSPAHEVEVQDESARMLCELSQLKATQQECLRLKFHDGLTYREIAELMNISHANVGFLIHTGLKTLRERLRNGNHE